MRWKVLSFILALAACNNSLVAQGSDVVRPSEETEKIALLHLKGRSAELTEHRFNLRLDLSQARFPDITDDRYPLEDRPLEKDFRVDQRAFCEAFNRKCARPEGTSVQLIKVECRYSHDVELGQITPVFRIKWTIRAPSGAGLVVVKGVGFGARYNELGISAERRRKLMLESAEIAYQEALFRCVLALPKTEGRP